VRDLLVLRGLVVSPPDPLRPIANHKERDHLLLLAVAVDVGSAVPEDRCVEEAGHHLDRGGSEAPLKIFNLVAARTGLKDDEALKEGFSPLSVDIETWDHKAYYPHAKKIRIRITGDSKTGRLLGAQIIGAYGTEVSKRVDTVAAAIHNGMAVESLSDLDLSYTPPLSSPWDPVQMAAQAWSKANHWKESVGSL
jgi:NADPH-dependent 2,4-dienoyl-CoA reductase/sulfur reductase-like enzyme